MRNRAWHSEIVSTLGFFLAGFLSPKVQAARLSKRFDSTSDDIPSTPLPALIHIQVERATTWLTLLLDELKVQIIDIALHSVLHSDFTTSGCVRCTNPGLADVGNRF
jgi:hypothetical protein